MTFLLHTVAPPLRADINFLYAAQGSMPYRRDRIFPTASTDLKINFGEPWYVEDPANGVVPAVLDDGWCMGLWNHEHIVHWPAKTDFIGVSFRPAGAHALLGLPMYELRNRVVPLEAIWGPAASRLRQRLLEAVTVERRFGLLEEFLLARLREKATTARVVGVVVKRIMARHGNGRIHDMREDIGVSHKHLITMFNRIVGCTPKELARLARFHHALDALEVTEPVRWTSIAHDNDFFDQSHFTREFISYSGLRPTDYLAQRRSTHAERPEHAAVPWVLPAG